MAEHAQAAVRGGGVAKVAREAFEKQTGKKIVSPLNAKHIIESNQPSLELPEQSNQD